jgi:RHS repeat-associated protein
MHRTLLQPVPPLRVFSPFYAALSIRENEWLAMRTLSVWTEFQFARNAHKQFDNTLVEGLVVLEGRTYTAESGYRYGFQAQEEDTELWEGAVNYKYRVEDPRLGRFFSVDPLIKRYAYYSSYSFSGNDVIGSKEIEGAEPDKLFESEWHAAYNFSLLFNDNSIRKNKEYACRIYVIDDDGIKRYAYTNPVIGKEASVSVKQIFSVPLPPGAVATAIAHTHGASSKNAPKDKRYIDNQFSGEEGSSEYGDIGVAEINHMNIYVATPNGSFQKYNWQTDFITLFPNTVAKDVGDGKGGAGTAAKSTSVYEVVAGDTLSHIAERYHTTIGAIAKENGISDVDKIQVGQKLNITN